MDSSNAERQYHITAADHEEKDVRRPYASVAPNVHGGTNDQHHDDEHSDPHAEDIDEDENVNMEDAEESEMFDFYDGSTHAAQPVETIRMEASSAQPVGTTRTKASSAQQVSKALPINIADEIRIMDLKLDKDFNAPLQCELRSVPLEDAGRYETLSYTWGESLPGNAHLSERIECEVGNKTYAVAITRNLETALQHIRRRESNKESHRVRFSIWTDAICIDQENDHERNTQVMMMAEIYSCSASLSIWLGDEGKAADEPSLIDYLRSPQADEILQRRWFGRRWVIQEVHSKVECCVVGIDGLWISWNKFCEALTKSGRSHPILRLHSGTNFQAASKQRLLLDLLQEHDLAGCCEPLDRFYALRGISSDRQELVVDYRRSFSEVCVHVATTYVKNPATLQKLLCCTAARHGVDSPRAVVRDSPPLPSWVPDWALEMSQCQALLYKHLTQPKTLFPIDRSPITEEELFSSPNMLNAYRKLAEKEVSRIIAKYNRATTPSWMLVNITTPVIVDSGTLIIPGYLIPPCQAGHSAGCTKFPVCTHFWGAQALVATMRGMKHSALYCNVTNQCSCRCADCHLERAFRKDRSLVKNHMDAGTSAESESSGSPEPHTYTFPKNRVFGVLTDLRTVLVLEPFQDPQHGERYTFHTCFSLHLGDLCKNFLSQDCTNGSSKPFHECPEAKHLCCKPCYDESCKAAAHRSDNHSSPAATSGKIAVTIIQIR